MCCYVHICLFNNEHSEQFLIIKCNIFPVEELDPLLGPKQIYCLLQGLPKLQYSKKVGCFASYTRVCFPNIYIFLEIMIPFFVLLRKISECTYLAKMGPIL